MGTETREIKVSFKRAYLDTGQSGVVKSILTGMIPSPDWRAGNAYLYLKDRDGEHWYKMYSDLETVKEDIESLRSVGVNSPMWAGRSGPVQIELEPESEDLEPTVEYIDTLKEVKFVIRHNRDYADIQATVHDINDVDKVVDSMLQATHRLNAC